MRLPPTETEQTVGVIVVNATANPEDAVAVKLSGVEVKACVPGFAKVIN